MNKFFFIVIIGIIGISTGVLGALTDNLKHYYSFDSGVDDDLGLNNGTNTGTVSAAGILGSARNFSGGSDFINIAKPFRTGDSWTISSWQYWPNLTTGHQTVLGCTDGNDGFQVRFPYDDDDTARGLVYRSGTTHFAASNDPVAVNQWVHTVITYNETNNDLNIYVNATIQTIDGTVTGGFVEGPTDCTFGRYSAGLAAHHYTGLIDEVGLWNRTLTDTEITELFNGGIAFNPLTAIVQNDTINLTTSPANGTQANNVNMTYNATVSSTANYNISLILNGIVNQTYTNVPSANASISFLVTYPANEETVTYAINATNTNGDSEQSEDKIVFIDTIQPDITWIVPANDNSTKSTGSFTSNITLFDNNMYGVRYNITYPNGSLAFSYENDSLINLSLTFVRIENQVTFDGSQRGNYTALVRACDGHTAREIPNMNPEYRAGELAFEPSKTNVRISLKNPVQRQSATYEKRADRYSYTFNTNAPSSSETFIVKSSSDIDIIQTSTYKGHLITGTKWIDFEGPRIDTVSVRRINSKMVEVDVTYKGITTAWEFDSIGELNCVVETRTFESPALIDPVITAPANNSVVGGAVPVTWSASGPSYVEYEAQVFNLTNDQVPIFTIISPTNGLSGLWQTNQFPFSTALGDGVYRVRVNATDNVEARTSGLITVTVENPTDLQIFSSVALTIGTVLIGILLILSIIYASLPKQLQARAAQELQNRNNQITALIVGIFVIAIAIGLLVLML